MDIFSDCKLNYLSLLVTCIVTIFYTYNLEQTLVAGRIVNFVLVVNIVKKFYVSVTNYGVPRVKRFNAYFDFLF